MRTTLATYLLLSAMCLALLGSPAVADGKKAAFNSKTDLISLHYDHAPDKDDGQSAAADRTVLESVEIDNGKEIRLIKL